MLHPFITCPALDRRISHPAVFSAVFHAVLFGIVIAPSRPAKLATIPRTSTESVRYLSLSLAAHRGNPASGPRRARTPRRDAAEAPHLAPWLATLDVAAALDAMPEPRRVELEFPVLKDSLPGGPLGETPYNTPARRLRGADATGYAARPDSDVFLAGEVDRTAMAVGTNPKPGYPMALVHKGVEATFTTMYVVDTTGRIDIATVQIPSAVDPRFSKAVRDALVRWHFLPAESGGRRVRQLIRQSFQFRLLPSGVHESSSDTEERT